MPKKNKIKRPPVVAILGHVDHGKSTLLEYLRKINITKNESGGITQHLGAYEVIWQDEDSESRRITFLDTPGHESFCSMRKRGVCLSDIAILIISAEESVKTQTLEAWQSIQEAEIPCLVAINKIDQPNANPDKVKQDLAENNIFLENYGGKIPSVNISAKTGEGIEELLSVLLLMADLENLEGDPQFLANGFILENSLDSQIGISATLIIKDGTLKKGDYLATNGQAFRIKRIINDEGKIMPSASFSSPIKVFGWKKIPAIGEPFSLLADKKEANEYEKNYIPENEECQTFSVEDQEKLIIPLIIKTDVEGTLEAIIDEIRKIKKEEIALNIIKMGVGTINEDDLNTAQINDQTIIIGFNTELNKSIENLINRSGVEIHNFSVIYKLKEWLEEELEKRRPRKEIEEIKGMAKILKIFNQQKNKQLIGGEVIDGYLKKKGKIKIRRRDSVIARGTINQLQQQKLEIEKVEVNNQFGALVDIKTDLMAGDIIEMFEIVTK